MKIIKREKFIIGPYLIRDQYIKYAENNNLKVINLNEVSQEDFKTIYQLVKSERMNIIINNRPFWLYPNDRPNTTHYSHFMFNDVMLINQEKDYDRFMSKSINCFREDIKFLTVYEK